MPLRVSWVNFIPKEREPGQSVRKGKELMLCLLKFNTEYKGCLRPSDYRALVSLLLVLWGLDGWSAPEKWEFPTEFIVTFPCQIDFDSVPGFTDSRVIRIRVASKDKSNRKIKSETGILFRKGRKGVGESKKAEERALWISDNPRPMHFLWRSTLDKGTLTEYKSLTECNLTYSELIQLNQQPEDQTLHKNWNEPLGLRLNLTYNVSWAWICDYQK